MEYRECFKSAEGPLIDVTFSLRAHTIGGVNTSNRFLVKWLSLHPSSIDIRRYKILFVSLEDSVPFTIEVQVSFLTWYSFSHKQKKGRLASMVK